MAAAAAAMADGSRKAKGIRLGVMASWHIMVLWMVALVGSAAASRVELTLSPAPPQHLAGEAVTVRCSAADMSNLDVLKVSKLVRGTEVDIATFNTLTADFRASDRYSILYSSEGKTGTIELQITDLSGSDAGTLQCRHADGMSGEEEIAAEELTVVVPPEKVEILYYAEDDSLHLAPEGSTIRLTDGRRGGFMCSVAVAGDDSPPDVTLTVGGRDVMDRFSKEEETTNDVAGGFWSREYHVQFSYVGTDHVTADNGQELVCTARTEHFEPVTASNTLEVSYAPQAACPEAVWTSADAAVLSCVVAMFPEPGGSSVSYGDGGDRVTLLLGDHDDSGRFMFDVTMLEDDRYNLTLTMSGLTPEDFRDYRLETSNSLGAAHWDIALRQVTAPPTEPAPKTTAAPPGGEGSVSGEAPPPPSSARRPLSAVCVLVLTLWAALWIQRA